MHPSVMNLRYMLSRIARGQFMGRVIIKLGGGLITDKSRYKTVIKDRIDAVSHEISRIIDLGHSVIVIHGAGSFGHIEAKKWRISDGFDLEISNQQHTAIELIRNDMDELNSIVSDSLLKFGVRCDSLPPRDWVNGVGTGFTGDVSIFNRVPHSPVPISFGDVVEIDDERQFGILSGDHLMVRIATELPDVILCAFLLGDTDGLLSGPPGSKDAQLIETWSKSQGFTGEHDKSIDVTGGILLKVRCASHISQYAEQVWFIDGRRPERLIDILSGQDVIGTRIVPG